MRVVGDWLLTLRERSDHEGRLLPFLLAGLADGCPAVAAEAARLLDAVGALYEKEHEKEVAELALYYPEALLAAGEEAAGEEDDDEEEKEEQQQGREQEQQAVLSADGADGRLPAALGGVPPRVGARLLVRANAQRLLMPLCDELSSWQDGPRRSAAALLEAVLPLLGDKVADHLDLLLPALVRAIRTPDARPHIRGCCAAAGRAGCLPAALPLLLARAAVGEGGGDGAGGGDGVDVRTQADAVLCLAHIARGAAEGGARGRRQLARALPALAGLLAAPAVCESEDASMRASWEELLAQLLAPAPLLCRCHGGALEPVVVSALAGAALLLYAPPAAASDTADATDWAAAAEHAARAEALLAQLARATGGGGSGGTDALLVAHRAELVRRFAPAAAAGSARHAAALCRALLPAQLARVVSSKEETERRLLAPLCSLEAAGAGSCDDGDGGAARCCVEAALEVARLLERGPKRNPNGRAQQLLLVALDALLEAAAAPAAEWDEPATEQLLFSLAPHLLGAGCCGEAVAAAAGARCVQRVMALCGAPAATLQRGWNRCCGSLCALLRTAAAADGAALPPPHAAVARQQACHAVRAAIERLGPAALGLSPQGAEGGDAGGSTAEQLAATVPPPLAQLLAALDDAQAAVRGAAAAALHAAVEALQCAAGGGGGGPTHADALRERLEAALGGRGGDSPDG